MKNLTCIGLDIDVGTPSSVVDAAIDKLGCLAVRYTTHSAFATETEIKRDAVIKAYPDDEIDSALMQKFMREKKGLDATVADTIELLPEPEQDTDGRKVKIAHAPLLKHRVVFPLPVSFKLADFKTEKEAAD